MTLKAVRGNNRTGRKPDRDTTQNGTAAVFVTVEETMKKTMRMLSALLLLGGLALAGAQSSGSSGNDADGAQIFKEHCASCHGSDGGGDSGPALAGNDDLDDKEAMLNTILNGQGAMPAWADTLSDEEIAAVATHERTSWGNDFGEVDADDVSRQRDESGDEEGGGGGAATRAQADAIEILDHDVLGEVLATDDGRIIYRFVNDAPQGESHCYSPCTSHWLPLTAGDGNDSDSDDGGNDGSDE